MNSLFWKFFGAFWLGLVLFVGVTLWLASNHLNKARTRTMDNSPRVHYMSLVHNAQSIAQQEGKKGLETWLRKLDFAEATPYFLVNRAGEDLLHRPLPDALAFRLEREGSRIGNERSQHMLRHRSSPRLVTIDVPGLGQYRLIPDHQGVTLTRILKRPRVIAFPLLLAALSSALICVFLARYLVRPINRLREATRRVALGEFDLAVSDKLNVRRDEIGELALDFDHMTSQLKSLLESQQQLLSDVSHELRSPLARLQMALGLLQQKVESTVSEDWPIKERQAALLRIERETEKMSTLIGRILSLSRLDSRTTQLKKREISLTTVLSEIIEDANFEAAGQRVTLRTTQPCAVIAHPELLISAVENVIHNALKYSPAEKKIEVFINNLPGHTVIVVCDRGPGVPEDQLETIFEPFKRLDEARHAESGGVGIGLALAKKIMEKHGGTISADNRKPGGLCVTLSFPQS